MATASYYIVYIKRRSDVTYEQVKEKMDLAVDWYRFQESFWILYTTGDEDKWYSRLSPFVKNGGSLFICRLDVKARQGWMTREFWNWLQKKAQT